MDSSNRVHHFLPSPTTAAAAAAATAAAAPAVPAQHDAFGRPVYYQPQPEQSQQQQLQYQAEQQQQQQQQYQQQQQQQYQHQHQHQQRQPQPQHQQPPQFLPQPEQPPAYLQQQQPPAYQQQQQQQRQQSQSQRVVKQEEQPPPAADAAMLSPTAAHLAGASGGGFDLFGAAPLFDAGSGAGGSSDLLPMEMPYQPEPAAAAAEAAAPATAPVMIAAWGPQGAVAVAGEAPLEAVASALKGTSPNAAFSSSSSVSSGGSGAPRRGAGKRPYEPPTSEEGGIVSRIERRIKAELPPEEGGDDGSDGAGDGPRKRPKLTRVLQHRLTERIRREATNEILSELKQLAGAENAKRKVDVLEAVLLKMRSVMGELEQLREAQAPGAPAADSASPSTGSATTAEEAADAARAMAVDIVAKDFQSRSLASQMVWNSGVAIVCGNVSMQCVGFNRAFSRLTGYHPRDLDGGLACASFSSPGDLSCIYQAVSRLMAADSTGSTFMPQRRWRCKTGELRVCRTTVTLVRNDQGQPAYIMAIITPSENDERPDPSEPPRDLVLPPVEGSYCPFGPSVGPPPS